MCVLKQNKIFRFGVLQEKKKIEKKKSIVIYYTNTNFIPEDGESKKSIYPPYQG